MRVLERLNFNGPDLLQRDGRLILRLNESDLRLALSKGIEFRLPEISELIVHVIY